MSLAVNVDHQWNNAFRIAKLSMLPGLTRWERKLLASMARRRRISPREQRIIDALCAKYLEGEAQ